MLLRNLDYRNTETYGLWSVRYRTGKANDAGISPVPDTNNVARHFLVRYPTEIRETGIPMPVLVL
jgi:hypothetical protein